MSQDDWPAAIRKKRRRQTLRAALGAVAALGIWLALSGLFIGAWIAVFHHLPASRSFLAVFEGLGSIIVLGFSKYIPLAPLKGEDPEVLAADEFFKGPQR